MALSGASLGRLQLRRVSRLGITSALLVAVLVLNIVATHEFLTAAVPGQNDFLARWESARAFWIDGISPYSDEATLRVQQRMYGRPVQGDEDPNLFAYPMYTVWVMLPLVFFDFHWASAVWIVILEVGLVASLLLLLDLYRWRPKVWLFVGFTLWSLANYFSARGLILGQLSHAVYLGLVVSLWALNRRHDLLAGTALALCTVKPQLVFLVLPVVLVYAARADRWRVVMGFASAMLALAVTSFVMLPSWFTDWVSQVRAYPSYTSTGSAVWVLAEYYAALPPMVNVATSAALWGGLAWLWWGIIGQARDERLAWAIMVTLVITHLTALRTATPHFVVFTIPLVFYLKQLSRKGGALGAGLLLTATFAMPWIHFLLTVDGRQEHASMYVPVPIAMLLLLWFTRRSWWAHGPKLSGHRPSGV